MTHPSSASRSSGMADSRQTWYPDLNKLLQHFFGALIAVALTTTMTSTAGAEQARGEGARWMRTLSAPSERDRSKTIFALLEDGAVLVRSGGGVEAIDAVSGRLRWSLPAIAGASVADETVVLRRPGVILAVRARDAVPLWRRPCVDPPFALAMQDRILTMCGGISTVLDRRNGRVLLERAVALRTSPMDIRDARALNGRFALVDNFFDGAWMGDSYYVVDSWTGAFNWSQTDFRVLAVTSTTITIAPYPSMLPWASTGTVVERRLSDGKTVHEYAYPPPGGATVTGVGTSACRVQRPT